MCSTCSCRTRVDPALERPTEAEYLAAALTSLWVVPIDDDTAKRFYLMFNDERNPLRRAAQARFRPSADRPYEERQRHPGDDEMMTEPGPDRRPLLEHLTPTDYGVIGVRQMLREGSARFKRARTRSPYLRSGYQIRTRTQNTVPQEIPPSRDARSRCRDDAPNQQGREVADSDLLHTLPVF